MTKQEEHVRALVQSVIQKETRYTIDVQDNSMLPEKMKSRKTVDFVIKPPTPGMLCQAAQHLLDIPREIMEKPTITLHDALPYIDQMIKTICVFSYGKKDDYPQWFEEFFKHNTTPDEIFKIFLESAMKMKTDFFLNSFHIASQNPMTLRKEKSKKKDTLTLSNS